MKWIRMIQFVVGVWLATGIGGGYCQSAILGGSDNVIPAGCNYVGMFGCGLGLPNYVNNCAFHSNNFVAQNMPIGTSVGVVLVPPLTLACGGLWYYPDPVSGACVVYIK
jgi:hypothetical protein